MLGIHRILYNDKPVGEATVVKEGLFYKIICKCAGFEDIPHCVVAEWNDFKLDLGICVRTGNGLGLTTRIQCGKIPTGMPVFRMSVKRRKQVGEFFPLRPEEPFRYIQRLNDAMLVKRGEEYGIVFKEL